MYIHEIPGWPDFEWEHEALIDLLGKVRRRQGRLIGQLGSLGVSLQAEAELEIFTSDVVKTSEIEGETLSKRQVRSSVARRLGVDIGALDPVDRHVEGLVEMILDATKHYQKPLTEERLFGWHAAMFPTGRSGISKIIVGAWRTDSTGPMQVVSGPIGREQVHFEAPEAERLGEEMGRFLNWIEGESTVDPVLRAGLAHLWFVTIHPFEDGNGRLARAIADLMLARSEGSQQRFYSMSTQIQKERKDYYDVLERTQKGSLNVTPWLEWFLNCLFRAIEGAEESIQVVLQKADFWRRANEHPVSERQKRVLNRVLDGFQGKLTTSKWAKLAKCSQDTAHRDILELVSWGLVVKNPGGGRNTSYSLTTS